MKLRNQLLWGAALTLTMGCNSVLQQPCTVGRAEGGAYLATATQVANPSACDPANNKFDVAAGSHFRIYIEKFGDTATSFGRHIGITPRSFLTSAANPRSATASAVGDLTSDFTQADPAAQGLGTCQAPALSKACVGAECYEFSNVKFLTEPGFQGAEMGFDLAYTDTANCTSTYQVIALQPFLPCVEDHDCHWDTIATDPTCNTVTQMLPNIPAHCNLDIGACEVTGTFPVVGPGFSCATNGFIP